MGVTIVDDLEEAVASLTSRSVMKRVFNDLNILASSKEFDENWFTTLVDVIQFTQDIEVGFSHAKAYALYIVHDNWESIPFSVRKHYDNSFWVFAKTMTGKEASTVDNYIRTARVWLASKKNLPIHKIRLIMRDEAGRPEIDDNGRIIIKYVDFLPYEVDMSKLLLVNARAVRGEMTDRLWELLVDEYATCMDIQIEVAMTAGNAGPGGDLSLKFDVVGPYLIAKADGEEAPIGELDWDTYYNDEDSLTHRAIQHLLTVLNIRLDEEVIENKIHRQRLSEGVE